MALEISIRFPYIGLEFENLKKGFHVFGFEITYYAVAIVIGMLLGYFVAEWQAGRTGQDKEIYLDFALYAIILSVIGARIYYVIFSWDEYKDNIWSIFNIRGGGLAIYGGIITAAITALVYCKLKKISFWLLADTACVGLITGQIIGRWGNFFNREAFGGYTDNFFAMQIRRAEVYYDGNVTKDILDHLVMIDGVEYIQVHPTFLYESLWNVCLLIALLLYTKHKKFDGEIILLYFAGYGLGRAWIESLRTDQLLLGNTGLAVSLLLSILLFVVSIIIIGIKRYHLKKKHRH